MEIEFSDHAKARLLQRSIPEKAARSILETNSSSSYRGRLIYQATFGGKILEVVVTKEDNKLVIITAYFLEQ